MKTYILISLFLCGTLIIQSRGMDFDRPDLDFYVFKTFDGPLYDSNFDEPYETYENSYSSEDNNENSSNGNSGENDGSKTAVVNEGDAAKVAEVNENSTSGEDSDEDNDSSETAEQSQPTVKKLKTVDPDQKKLKESTDYVSPADVAYRLSRQKRSKKPKSEDPGNDDEEFDAYAKTYRDFVQEHFGKHDEVDDDENDASEEAAEAQAARVNNHNQSQENGEDDDESGEETDNADDPDYQHVRKLSEREAEESKRNPQYCKIIYKDDQECTVCKNPKTHETSESCSYSSSPAPKRYAFKRQKNYNSKDNDDDDENDDTEDGNDKIHSGKQIVNESEEDDEAKPKKRNSNSKKSKKNRKSSKKSEDNPVEEKLRTYENPHYYGNYYNNDRHTNSPLRSQTLSEYDDDLSFRASEPYAASTSSDGNVDKVLESFKNRDWSKCKHKREKGITCYYCKDTDGTTQEECMYSSDMDEENLQSGNKKKHFDTVSEFSLKNKPTTQTPFSVNDDSIYKNPSSILTTFNNNNPKERKLNRDQNFKINPTSNYQDNVNYGTHLRNNQQNRRTFNVDAPITTLEYIEPKNKKTLKRMVTYKVHEDDIEEKDPIENKSLFYSKVIHGFTI